MEITNNNNLNNFNWKNLFLQRVSVDIIINQLLLYYNNNLNDVNQNDINNYLLKYKNYSPPLKWYKYLLKRIINEIERNNNDIIDELIERMIEINTNIKFDEEESDEGMIIFPLPLVNNNNNNNNNCNNNAIIHAKKIHNQVGMRLWTAGIFLSDFMIRLPLLCNNRNILELGAGTGCTGILLALSTSLNKIIMTDFHPTVVENLQYNIDFNFNNYYNSNNNQTNSIENILPTNKMSCEVLDWIYYTKEDIKILNQNLPSPIILAADCIYSIDLSKAIVTMITELLYFSIQNNSNLSTPLSTPSSSSSSSTLTSSINSNNLVEQLFNPSLTFPYALIVQTIRSPETYEFFISYLQQILTENPLYCNILAYQDITENINQILSTSQPLFYYENQSNIRIICIFPLNP